MNKKKAQDIYFSVKSNPKQSYDRIAKTEREKERLEEDRECVPVILKRTDEVVKHPDDTLNHAISEGTREFSRSNLSLFISSVAGGLIIGFVGISVAFSQALIEDPNSWVLQRLLKAIFYPIGFIICVMSGAKLYTEQTATAIYPVLEGKKDKCFSKTLVNCSFR